MQEIDEQQRSGSCPGGRGDFVGDALGSVQRKPEEEAKSSSSNKKKNWYPGGDPCYDRDSAYICCLASEFHCGYRLSGSWKKILKLLPSTRYTHRRFRQPPAFLAHTSSVSRPHLCRTPLPNMIRAVFDCNTRATVKVQRCRF